MGGFNSKLTNTFSKLEMCHYMDLSIALKWESIDIINYECLLRLLLFIYKLEYNLWLNSVYYELNGENAKNTTSLIISKKQHIS